MVAKGISKASAACQSLPVREGPVQAVVGRQGRNWRQLHTALHTLQGRKGQPLHTGLHTLQGRNGQALHTGFPSGEAAMGSNGQQLSID